MYTTGRAECTSRGEGEDTLLEAERVGGREEGEAEGGREGLCGRAGGGREGEAAEEGGREDRGEAEGRDAAEEEEDQHRGEEHDANPLVIARVEPRHHRGAVGQVAARPRREHLGRSFNVR